MASKELLDSRHDPDRSRSSLRPKSVKNTGSLIGKRFRRARKAQRLSQEQVAELTTGPLGTISRTTVSAIERGRVPSVDALVSISRVLHLDPSDLLEQFELDGEAARDLDERTTEQLREQAEELFWAGDYRGALQCYEALEKRILSDPELDETRSRHERARIEIYRASALRNCSALRAAEEAAKRAADLAQGDPESQASAFMILSSIHLSHRHMVVARALADQATIVAAEADERTVGRAWQQKGSVLYQLGSYREARQAFLEARRFLIEARDTHNRIKVEGNIGTCLVRLGQRGAARKRFIAAIEHARELGDSLQESSWLIELGLLTLDEGRSEDADRYAIEALRIARPLGRVLNVFRGEWLRYKIKCLANPANQDERRLARLRRLYPRVRAHRYVDAVREFRAQIFEAEGEPRGSA